MLRRATLPVDSCHHRVVVQTGLIPLDLAVGPAHRVLAAQLPPDWDAQTVCDNHKTIMLYGQRCRFPQRPGCLRLDLYPARQRFADALAS